MERKLKMEGESYESEQDFFFFFFFCCHFLKRLKFVWVYQNGNLCGENNQEMGNFVTSPTFDCTPGYAPGPYRDVPPTWVAREHTWSSGKVQDS